MKTVVTGASGFIGQHYVHHLAGQGHEVEMWTRRALTHDVPSHVSHRKVDIVDREAVDAALLAANAQLIVHLAAQSLPNTSWERPADTYEANVLGSIHLLEAMRRMNKPPRLLMAGSSAEYADSTNDHLITEEFRRQPNSPYAASKIAAVDACLLYAERYGLDVIVFRPFAVYGPGKTGDLCSDIAERIVAIERGSTSFLRVGNLEVVRDVVDVRDCMAAFDLLAMRGNCGECYNISSGKGTSIQSIIDVFRSLSTHPIEVRQDPSLKRPLDQAAKLGCPEKLLALNWYPKYDLSDTLASVLEEKRINL